MSETIEIRMGDGLTSYKEELSTIFAMSRFEDPQILCKICRNLFSIEEEAYCEPMKRCCPFCNSTEITMVK